MALSSGFFNSVDHDRLYDARQFSRIFDGIISDGVYATIGECFIVKVESGRTVTIGTGRAWFNGTWTLNDAPLPITLPLSDVVTNRIDAVVLEVDTRDQVRNNSIQVIQGNPAPSPVRPTFNPPDGVFQYPLCYIYRGANSATINQSEITNRVGSSETPFVTGILQTIAIDELLLQWSAELDEFIDRETGDFDRWAFDKKNEIDAWFEEEKDQFDNFQGENEELYQQWITATEETFNTWLSQLQTNLGEDAAGNLQIQIQNNEIKRILTAGFADGTKTISRDGKNIIATSDSGMVLKKVFSDDFSTMTAILTSAEGGQIAKQVKTFDPSGELITISTTYNYGKELG